jgi:hypothetical protein
VALVVERINLGKHRKTIETVLPLVAVIALLLVGLWVKWPNFEYDGPATPSAYDQFASYHFAFSDIAWLYFQDGLWAHPLPYFDYPLEYPVGLGLLTYLLNLVAYTMPQYFLLTSLAMALSALGIAILVPYFPQGRLLLFILSPAVALYFIHNWDMWGVLLMVVSLLLFVRKRDSLATTVLAAAVWTKFFPILFLPFLVLDRLRWGGRWAAGRIVLVFAVVSAAINIPVLLFAPAGWWYFFAFNSARPALFGPWRFFDPLGLSTAEINRLSTLLVLGGLVLILILQVRLSPRSWLPAGCAMLAWFFFVNKAYSPQYALWIVVLLAVIGAAPALAVAWSAADLLYFAAIETWGALADNYGEAPQQWFAHYVLLPATALHEGGLLLVIGWCVKEMHASRRRDLPEDRGEQRKARGFSDHKSMI